jgi:hypothetical protein
MSAYVTPTTLAEANALYLQNSNWEGDPAKAQHFAWACRALAILLAQNAAKGGASMGFDTKAIQAAGAKAQAYVDQAGTGNGPSGTGSVIHPTFRNFRD